MRSIYDSVSSLALYVCTMGIIILATYKIAINHKMWSIS
jgi:hypothetical protein